MTYTRTSARAVFLSAAFALMAVIPAYAGFEWKGPVAPPPSSPASASPAPLALPGGGMAGLEPVITWDGDMTTPGAMPAVRPEGVEKTDIASPAGDSEVLEGFGSSLPLVIALQQVTPAGYRVSFAPGVDPGAPVSWSGGRPWKRVLSDMLAVQGLGYKLEPDGAIVVSPLSSGGGTQAASVAPMPPAMDTPIPLMPSAQEEIHPPIALGQFPQDGKSGAPVSIRRQKPASFPGKPGGIENAGDAWMSGKAVEAPLALGKVGAENVAADVSPAAPSAWRAGKGQTLREVLKGWSDTAKVDLYWSIDYDYRLENDVALSGAYDEAVSRLLDRFAVVRPQPYGQLHQAAGGPKVLVIKSYDVAG